MADSYMNGITKDYDTASQVSTAAKAAESVQKTTTVSSGDISSEHISAQQFVDELLNRNASKEPTKSTIDSAISDMNAKMSKTRCSYAYDEDTKRITIKVYDEKTDELIREVPPEKSLEVLKKVWEIAGIIIDEKR